ncbi:MAG: nucleotide sugar dehydrogenase [Candidatus Poribacteria bacterium]|nr:nucleotide sugar dehydrogenase [Candidatus Poribacteria bacterium]
MSKPVIGVVGLWHLGCVIAASWASLGHRVVGVDFDAARADSLAKGKPPLFEPNLEETVREHLDNGRLSFSSEALALSECDVVFLTYDTPVREDDTSDTSILFESIETFRGTMKHGAILIVSSQTPVGTCRELRTALKAASESLEIAYSPENLRLGDAINCYLNPGYVVVGTPDSRIDDTLQELFSAVTDDVVLMSLESSEVVKHGINSFLATSVTFANHLSDICEVAGADMLAVTAAMKRDPRIGQKAYLTAGIGFSGGTLGRDLQALDAVNRAHDGEAAFFKTIHDFNLSRKDAVARRIRELLGGSLKGKVVGVWGLTYKPGTSTLRRSLPLEIVALLRADGIEVRAFDPKADYGELANTLDFLVAESAMEACRGADLLVLLTEWDDFKSVDWDAVKAAMRSAVVFDTKNLWKDAPPESLTYHGLGRGLI